MKNKLSTLELKWIMYDVGNSAFILLATSIMPIYFNHLATQAGLSETEYLSWWSYAASIATICVAIAGPLMGTLADFDGNKKKSSWAMPWPAHSCCSVSGFPVTGWRFSLCLSSARFSTAFR